MKFLNLLLIAFFVHFFALSHRLACSDEPPLITVSPEGFAKTVVRVSPLVGDDSDEVSGLIRRALNLHLIVIALEDREGKNFKDPTLSGSIKRFNNHLIFEGQLSDPIAKKSFSIRAEATNPVLLGCGVADKVVEILTGYKGISLSRIVLVRRTSRGDELIITDPLKRDYRSLLKAEMILFPKFSPSGKKLAYLVFERRQFRLEVFNLTDGTKEEYHLRGLSGPPVWLPREDQLILTLEDQGNIDLYLLNLRDKKKSQLIKGGAGLKQAGTVSPDGSLLAFVASLRDKPQVYLLNLKSPDEPKRVSIEGAQATSPRFSPKGNLLIYLVSQRTLVMYDLTNHKRRQIALPLPIADPSFSPTGDYLIFRSKDKKGGIYILHLDSLVYHPFLTFGNLYYPDWGRL